MSRSPAALLLLARVVSGATTFLLFVALARLFDSDQLGLFALALSISYVLASLSDGGLGMLAVREVAQNAADTGLYFGAVLAFRSAAALPVLLVALAVGAVYGGDAAPIIVVAAAAGYLQFTANSLRSLFIAHGLFGTVAALVIAENIVWIASVLLAGLLTGSVLAMFVTAGLVYAASVVATSCHVAFRLKPSGIRGGVRGLPSVLRRSAGFAAFVTLGTAHAQIDTIVASALLPLPAVAVFQVALRTLYATDYVPEAVSRAAYPELSRAAGAAGSTLMRLAGNLARDLALIGTVVGGVVFATAAVTIPALFGPEYAAAVVLLQVLAIAIPIRYLSAAYGTALSASGEQRSRAVAVAVLLPVTILLDVSLIWALGPLGAAMAAVGSSALLLLLYVVAARRGRGIGVNARPQLVVGVFAVLATVLLVWPSADLRATTAIILLAPLGAAALLLRFRPNW